MKKFIAHIVAILGFFLIMLASSDRSITTASFGAE